MKQPIFPRPLQKGDKIAVISPAGFVKQKALEKTLALIKANGYEPVIGKHALGSFSFGYTYSGTEEERLEDLNWALNDESIAAIWASRGGYGTQHLLQGISLDQFSKNPKWYIGYSDNTAIQSYLLEKGYASIHGQTIKTASFGVSPESYDGIFEILKGNKPLYSISEHSKNRKGTAEGLLVGGNLALVYALLGSAFSFNFEDKILFLEDIGEKHYALDRMLMGLELAGVFHKIKGLIIGGMINMGEEDGNPNYEQAFDELSYEIISKRTEKYSFPIAFGFPNGHIFDNRPLIIGANVKMKVGDKVEISF